FEHGFDGLRRRALLSIQAVQNLFNYLLVCRTQLHLNAQFSKALTASLMFSSQIISSMFLSAGAPEMLAGVKRANRAAKSPVELAWDNSSTTRRQAALSLSHRDIHAGNILIRHHPDPRRINDGCVKIADFGQAREIRSAMDAVMFPRFSSDKGGMAPEVLQRLPYDYKADIFSAGFVMLSVYRYLERKLKQPLGQDASNKLPGLIDWLEQKDPQKRPTAAKALEWWARSIEVLFVNGNAEQETIVGSIVVYPLTFVSLRDMRDL
ncbi:Kinase, NEK, partial [Paramuricea clavata]